jgi:hypothetical protein
MTDFNNFLRRREQPAKNANHKIILKYDIRSPIPTMRTLSCVISTIENWTEVINHWHACALEQANSFNIPNVNALTCILEKMNQDMMYSHAYRISFEGDHADGDHGDDENTNHSSLIHHDVIEPLYAPIPCRDLIHIPSISVCPQLIKQIPGLLFYEERLLCLILRLNNPTMRLIYVTSLPVR